jgi:hypothetical protein
MNLYCFGQGCSVSFHSLLNFRIPGLADFALIGEAEDLTFFGEDVFARDLVGDIVVVKMDLKRP